MYRMLYCISKVYYNQIFKMLKNSYPKNVQPSVFFAATYLYVVTQ